MKPERKEQLIVDSSLSLEPEIGRWLWAIEDTRRRTLQMLSGLSPRLLDWRPEGAESSISTILYHLADIEADWLYVEALGQPFPPEVAALFQHPTRDEQGHLSLIEGYTLEQLLQRLENVRRLLLAGYLQMDLIAFRRVRSLPQYDVTPEYVLHHLMQHEAEHRSQIGGIINRARLNLTSS